MSALLTGLDLLLGLLRSVLFAGALVVAACATASWAVRTRRLSPFGPAARFVRGTVDPLFRPAERRLLQRGALPAQAPWWTLAAFVVGAIVVISLLGFVRTQLLGAAMAASAGPRGILVLLVAWSFALLRIALLARVVSSWFQLSPWSRWIRWSFVLTEWILRPLRQVIPSFGGVDLTPIVAYFVLSLLEGFVLRLV